MPVPAKAVLLLYVRVSAQLHALCFLADCYPYSVDEPDCYITYDISQDELVLWIPKQRTPREIYYMGPVLTPELALEKYDIDSAKPADALGKYLKDFIHTSTDTMIYVLHKDDVPQDEYKTFRNLSEAMSAACYIHNNVVCAGEHGSFDTERLMPAMNSCRVIKDDFEIGYIREANRISAIAHTEVLKNITKVKNEAAVEGIFTGTCLALGVKKQAYPPIAGSGQNAATLHYVNNNEALEGRQVLLLDAGCEVNCYACDVTRTFPIGIGWPSNEAKQIYDLVTKMQVLCIAQMKPGNHFGNVHVLAHYVATHGLLQLGILQNGSIEEIVKAGTTLAFFPHGLGHHVGLEVHDVEDATDPMSIMSDKEKVEFVSFAENYSHLIDPATCRAPVTLESSGLREGMVVTVEPGM
jgi:Xaa-Pro dipeptidase